MKRSAYISILLLISGVLSAQQFPFMEGYHINPYGLSPAYAGVRNVNTLFLDYRADWAGLDGGPRTYQVSFNSSVKERIGLGGKFIYDKTDIFKQTLLTGTYGYTIKISDRNLINLAISAGVYRNSIDLAKYFNNPDYVTDNVLILGMQDSKMKFISDVSALYRNGNFESGILFSNLIFGSVKYSDVSLSYKPFSNYLLHMAYDFRLSDQWSLKPIIIWRDGKNVPGILEADAAVSYMNKVWATAVFRTGGIFGMGVGAQIFEGVLLNYSYNLSTGVALNTFGSHQVTLGFRLFKPRGGTATVAPPAIEVPVAQEVTAIQGTIYRKADNRLAPGVITIYRDNSEIQKKVSDDGNFTFELNSGNTYRIEVSSPDYQTVSQTVEIPAQTLTKEVRIGVDFMSLINLDVKDEATGNALDATGSVIRNGAPVQSVRITGGKSSARLPQGAIYDIEISASGYYTNRTTADLTTRDLADLNIRLQRIREESFELRNVNFETGKSVITQASLPFLDSFIKLLKDNPELKFEISGHTDNVGSPELNKRISLERAMAVVNYMVSQGIDPNRLKPVGYGPERPIAPNNTPENRARNRRVEAKILK